MRAIFLCGLAGLMLLPAGFAATKRPRMSGDMRRAIAFERYKDVAAARQARKERVRPSINPAAGRADRMRDEAIEGQRVADPGEREWQQHQKQSAGRTAESNKR